MRKRVDEWLTPESLTLIKGWRRDGLTYEQIAHNMGIHVSCLYKWLKEYVELKEAIKKGEEVMIYEVENAMYKSALGYDVIEAEETQTMTENGPVTVTRKRKRHIPPNVAAQFFILKNRRSAKWQENPVVIDTTALDKLDSILMQAKENANAIQREAERVHTESESPV